MIDDHIMLSDLHRKKTSYIKSDIYQWCIDKHLKRDQNYHNNIIQNIIATCSHCVIEVFDLTITITPFELQLN